MLNNLVFLICFSYTHSKKKKKDFLPVCLHLHFQKQPFHTSGCCPPLDPNIFIFELFSPFITLLKLPKRGGAVSDRIRASSSELVCHHSLGRGAPLFIRSERVLGSGGGTGSRGGGVDQWPLTSNLVLGCSSCHVENYESHIHAGPHYLHWAEPKGTVMCRCIQSRMRGMESKL